MSCNLFQKLKKVRQKQRSYNHTLQFLVTNVLHHNEKKKISMEFHFISQSCN